jgi:hypothetical protein
VRDGSVRSSAATDPAAAGDHPPGHAGADPACRSEVSADSPSPDDGAEAAQGAAASGTAANAAQETFTASGGNWGTITHWGLYDAETNGNLLIYGALDASRTINDGDSLTFAAGAIDITAA